ncbi:bifunctional L-3-cyanoalanine synthase/cysteine synthase 1, mitochondrial, partial [Tanacetum coccineum]
IASHEIARSIATPPHAQIYSLEHTALFDAADLFVAAVHGVCGVDGRLVTFVSLGCDEFEWLEDVVIAFQPFRMHPPSSIIILSTDIVQCYRHALFMMNNTEEKELFTPAKTVLIEPTSGNMGIIMAFMAALKVSRILLIAMRGTVKKAYDLLENTPDASMLQQFSDPANTKIVSAVLGSLGISNVRSGGDAVNLQVIPDSLSTLSQYLTRLRQQFNDTVRCQSPGAGVGGQESHTKSSKIFCEEEYLAKVHNANIMYDQVGYTNAGKSTLLNQLTWANVLAEDRLFATLDPTTRRVQVHEEWKDILLTDTIGFIQKLPTTLLDKPQKLNLNGTSTDLAVNTNEEKVTEDVCVAKTAP